jgi:hypothetical protein
LQHIVRYTPQKNRVVERKNRSLKEMASFMLHAKSLPQRLWAKALNYATYIQKRSPRRFVKDKTPYEAWSGLKPEVAHFCIFGSRAWARIPSKKRKELNPQSTKCVFVGYPDSSLSVASNSRKVSCMYLSSHMQTPSLFHLFEMMSMHMLTLIQTRVLIHRN